MAELATTTPTNQFMAWTGQLTDWTVQGLVNLSKCFILW